VTVDRHLQAAIAELHAARLSLQGAILAVRRAVDAGEPAAEANLRVIDAEFRGTAEEAAVFGVLLDHIRATRAE
jgi:hypothetical protein